MNFPQIKAGFLIIGFKTQFDKWYNAAIRADMSIGEEYESGFYDDYYDLDGTLVQNQIAAHGEY